VRFYDVAVTSLVIRAPQKWTDNLLSQHTVPDVVAQRRGVARKIPHSALIRLALVRQLHTELGMSVRDALAMADWLLRPDSDGVHQRGHLRVTIDRAALERALDERLRDTLESAPAPPRGRPPRGRPRRRDSKGGRTET
jgi:hypothetical protein